MRQQSVRTGWTGTSSDVGGWFVGKAACSRHIWQQSTCRSKQAASRGSCALAAAADEEQQ